MQVQELMVWSAACGAIALLTFLSLARALRHSAWATWRRVLWFAFSFHFLLFHSGIASYLYPDLSPESAWLGEIMVGPLWLCVSTFFHRFTLRASQRSQAMNVVLWLSAVGGLGVLAFIVLRLPASQQLSASTQLTLSLAIILVGVSIWAALLGDTMSWGVVGGLVLAMPTLMFLHSIPLHVPQPLWVQTILALASVLNALLIAAAIRPRVHHGLSASPFRVGNDDGDMVVHMHSGADIAKKILAAQRRQVWVGGPGVVIAITVFQTESLLRRYGAQALESLYMRLGAIIEAQVGHMNPVGRFGSNCFIVLIETVQSPEVLQALMDTVAEHLRQPLSMCPVEGASSVIEPDIGMGSVNLTYFDDVNSVLLDAQEAAEFNRLRGIPDPVTSVPSFGESTQPNAEDRLDSYLPSRSSVH